MAGTIGKYTYAKLIALIRNFSKETATSTVIAGNTADSSALTNPTSETAHDLTLTISADTLVVGDRLCLSVLGGIADAAGTSNTLFLKLKVTDGTNTHTLVTWPQSSAGNPAHGDAFMYMCDIFIQTAGASGEIHHHGIGSHGRSTQTMVASGGGDKTLKTNVDITFSITAQWSGSNAGQITSIKEFSITKASLQ